MRGAPQDTFLGCCAMRWVLINFPCVVITVIIMLKYIVSSSSFSD